MPYFSSFYVKVDSDPEVVFLALWRVGVHAEWRSVHSRLQLSLFALGIWTICYEPLVSGSSCSLFGVWRNAWFDNGYMFCVSRMAFGSIYNFYVTGWTRLLRSILAMLRLLVCCPWKSVHYFYEPPVFSAFSTVDILR